jgi:hypothetical protein
MLNVDVVGIVRMSCEDARLLYTVKRREDVTSQSMELRLQSNMQALIASRENFTATWSRVLEHAHSCIHISHRLETDNTSTPLDSNTVLTLCDYRVCNHFTQTCACQTSPTPSSP